MVEVIAPNIDAARHSVVEMSLSDLAMTGRADLLSFKLIPGEINKVITVDGDDDDDDETPKRSRPSGWYRPRYE